MLDESVIQMIQLIGALLFGTIIGWYVYLIIGIEKAMSS